MAPPDAVPDHYAALEVSPNCSIEDINKAYKKLALKYHPDRNRGKEEDVVPRFQAIQAAHEVLKEQDTRKRYDLSRSRPTGASGYGFGAASGSRPNTRGNPYQAHSDFPPPPMRSNPRRGADTPTGKARPRPSDAYFPPPPPPRPQPKTSTNKESRERANMFEAWSSMHGRKSPERKTQQAFPQAHPQASAARDSGQYGQRDDSRSRPSRTSSNDDPKKSAYEHAKAFRPDIGRNPSQRTAPKRSGFDPSTPGGDERAAPRAGYNASHLRSDHDSSANMSGYTQSPRGTAPTAKRSEPEQSYFDAYGDPNRARAAYDKFAEDMKRSASTQDTTERGPFGRNGYNNRNRSESPQRRPAPAPSQSFPIHSDDSNSNSDIEAAAARAKFRSPPADPSTRPKATPRPRRSGTSTPSSNPPTGMDGSKDNTFSFDIKPDTFDRSFGAPPEAGKINTDFTRGFPSVPSFDLPQEQTKPSQPDFNATPFTFRGVPVSASAQPTAATTPLASPQPPPPKSANGAAPTGSGTFSATQWQQTMRSENWASKWANPPQAAAFTPSQSPTRRSRSMRQTSRTASSTARPVTIADEEAGLPVDLAADDGNAMDVDMTVPAATTTSAEAAGPPIPPKVPEHPQAAPSPARMVFVEPTGHNRAQSQASYPVQSGPYAPPPPSTTQPTSTSHPVDLSATPAPQAPNPPPASSRPAAHTLNLHDFRHVAPFDTKLANGAGLTDLKDISSTLPFPSKPSTLHPTKSTSSTSAGDATATAPATAPAPSVSGLGVGRELPRLPKAPAPPTKLSDEGEVSAYIHAMAAYLDAWSVFKMAMVSEMIELTGRLGEMETCASPSSIPLNLQSQPVGTGGGGDGKGKNVMANWLLANGETEGKRGWESYRRGEREEERVRVYWNVACDRHREAVDGHERVRERLRGLQGL